MPSLTTIDMYDGVSHSHLSEASHEWVSDAFREALNTPNGKAFQFEDAYGVWTIVRVDEVKIIRSYTLTEPLDKVRARLRNKSRTKDLNAE